MTRYEVLPYLHVGVCIMVGLVFGHTHEASSCSVFHRPLTEKSKNTVMRTDMTIYYYYFFNL